MKSRPDSKDELWDFCRQEHLHDLDVHYFWLWYQTTDWEVGDNPWCRDWKDAARLWNCAAQRRKR